MLPRFLSPTVGLPADEFQLFHYITTYSQSLTELTRLQSSLRALYIDSETVIYVKKGQALKSGEHKINLVFMKPAERTLPTVVPEAAKDPEQSGDPLAKGGAEDDDKEGATGASTAALPAQDKEGAKKTEAGASDAASEDSDYIPLGEYVWVILGCEGVMVPRLPFDTSHRGPLDLWWPMRCPSPRSRRKSHPSWRPS